MTVLRRFKESGIATFRSFLMSTSETGRGLPPEELLSRDETEEVPGIEIDARKFSSRFELAEYLCAVLDSGHNSSLDRDVGMWAWLSAFYFDQLCRENEDGRRSPGHVARWIPDLDNYKTYYRHLLVGPYRVYRAHADDPSRCIALLCNPVDAPGEIYEQIASRQEIITNRAIVEATKVLYWNATAKQPKRGAGGSGAGSARRLASIINQFDLTWDLYASTCDDFMSLLPAEFDRFRPK